MTNDSDSISISKAAVEGRYVKILNAKAIKVTSETFFIQY